MYYNKVNSDPEVTFTARAREDECLLLASGGLWGVMSNEEVCEVAKKRILKWWKCNRQVTLFSLVDTSYVVSLIGTK